MLHHFIQWPRESLKLVKKETLRKTPYPSSSSHRDASRNVSSPSLSSYRGVSSQIHIGDVAASSPYVPQQMQQSILLENLDDHELIDAPNSNLKFVDPELTSALEKVRKRPRSIQNIVKLLSKHMGDENAIISSSPKGMYRETYVEGLSYMELLQLFSMNVCLDISVIHLFAM
ncbi:hypothetical protein R6Q57_027734 [Mikania cordata]